RTIRNPRGHPKLGSRKRHSQQTPEFPDFIKKVTLLKQEYEATGSTLHDASMHLILKIRWDKRFSSACFQESQNLQTGEEDEETEGWTFRETCSYLIVHAQTIPNPPKEVKREQK